MLWYPALGLGTAATSLAAAAIGMTDRPGTARAAGSIAVAAATVTHLMATLRAAPIMIGLRAGIDHPTAAVAADLDRFARVNALRAGAMIVALAAASWTATRSDVPDQRSR